MSTRAVQHDPLDNNLPPPQSYSRPSVQLRRAHTSPAAGGGAPTSVADQTLAHGGRASNITQIPAYDATASLFPKYSDFRPRSDSASRLQAPKPVEDSSSAQFRRDSFPSFHLDLAHADSASLAPETPMRDGFAKLGDLHALATEKSGCQPGQSRPRSQTYAHFANEQLLQCHRAATNRPAPCSLAESALDATTHSTLLTPPWTPPGSSFSEHAPVPVYQPTLSRSHSLNFGSSSRSPPDRHAARSRPRPARASTIPSSHYSSTPSSHSSPLYPSFNRTHSTPYPLTPAELQDIALKHKGRIPSLLQLAPPSNAFENGQPIVNTGNQGPMLVQAGDWTCGSCSFINWRRRKICLRCFPFANDVGESLAETAEYAARLAASTSPSTYCSYTDATEHRGVTWTPPLALHPNDVSAGARARLSGVHSMPVTPAVEGLAPAWSPAEWSGRQANSTGFRH